MRWDGYVTLLGDIKMHKKFCSEHLKGRENSEDLGGDGKIILEWILSRVGRCGLDASG
jgi:hypothetical protein